MNILRDWTTRLALAIPLASAVAGCSGDPDAVAAVPAEGTILVKGKPLEEGNIQFVPESGRSASGAVKNGHFTLTTYDANDGAIPGKHRVVVVSYKEVKVRGSTEPEQRLITPEKYSNVDATDLVVEIPPGGKRDLEIKAD